MLHFWTAIASELLTFLAIWQVWWKNKCIFVMSAILASFWNLFYQIPFTWWKKLHLASQIFKIEAALEKAGNQHCLSNWHPLIGSRSIFDEDHDIFRSSVRKFMRNELAPEHKRYEAQVQSLKTSTTYISMLFVICTLLKYKTYWVCVYVAVQF